MVLIDKKTNAELIIDTDEFPDVIRATKNLQTDIKRARVIVGANKRGTMYGIYSLSEQIGVSP